MQGNLQQKTVKYRSELTISKRWKEMFRRISADIIVYLLENLPCIVTVVDRLKLEEIIHTGVTYPNFKCLDGHSNKEEAKH